MRLLTAPTLYTKKCKLALFGTIFLTTVGILSGCATRLSVGQKYAYGENVLQQVNAIRQEAGLAPLVRDTVLDKTALARAKQAAADNNLEPEANSLPRIVEGGAYARFSLSHIVKGDKVEPTLADLYMHPLGKSIIKNPHLTHIEIGRAHV